MRPRERAADVWAHTEIGRQTPTLPDWDDLRLLMSVVGEGSLGRASRMLGLTQPTMSRRIRRLEHSLRTPLVTRTNRGVTLTIQAQHIVEELKTAQAAIERAIGRSSARTDVGEEFKLVTTDGLAVHWLPRFASPFIERNAGIDLRIFAAADPGTAHVGHYDFAVHDVAPSDPNLLTIRLGHLHFMPYASRGYLARHGHPQSATALGQHRLLDSSLHLVDWGSWTSRLSETNDDLRARYFTNSSASLQEAVRSDAGIALLPTYAAVFAAELVPLDLGIHFARPFWLTYRRDAMAKSMAGKVLSFVKLVHNRRTMAWFADEFRGGAFANPSSPEDLLGDVT